MKKVLCVCFANTCRSPIMAALLQLLLGNEFLVESAGARERIGGRPANEYAVLCMKERGINITSHRNRWMGDLDLAEFSHIVCVDEDTAEKVRQLLATRSIEDVVVLVVKAEGGGVPNPYEKGLLAYQECAALLEKVLPKIAEQIRG